jgi:hypothetical protein
VGRYFFARLAQLKIGYFVAMGCFGSGFCRFGFGFVAQRGQLGHG